MTYFEFPPDDEELSGECRKTDDTNFWVDLSLKLSGQKPKKVSGAVSMTCLREPTAKEKDWHGIILPAKWLKRDIEKGRSYGIFRARGDMLEWFAKELARIMSGGETVGYIGMPTGDHLLLIAAERCEELKTAREFLSNLYDFESLHDTVVEAYKEHIKHATDLAIDNAFEFMRMLSPGELASMFNTATRKVTSFLALFRLYWETLSGGSTKKGENKGQRFFSHTGIGKVVDETVGNIASDSQEHIDWVVKGYCPLALHGKPIVDLLSWRHKSDEDAYHRWFTAYVEIKTSDIPSHLRTKAQNALRNSPAMGQSLAEGMDALSDVHLSVREALKDEAANARNLIEQALAEWKEELGEEHSATDIGNLFTLFERNKGCNLDIRETGIGLSWDMHTRVLEEKHSRHPSYSELAVEVIERYKKKFLSGYKIALIGRFPNRTGLVSELEKRGAEVVGRLSASVDVAIEATELTDKQRTEAEKHGIVVQGYAVVRDLISNSTPPSSPNYLRPMNVFASKEKHFAHILQHYGVKAEPANTQ